MKNKNYPTVEAVIKNKSAFLLELVLMSDLTDVDNNKIRQNTRALLDIVFKTKDSAPERTSECHVVTEDVYEESDEDLLLLDEMFSRQAFSVLLSKIDTKKIRYFDLYAFYNDAKKNNQLINFIDLVIKYQFEQAQIWLTDNNLQYIVKEAIESPRLSFDDFQSLLYKLTIPFVCADKSIIDGILVFASAFSYPIHKELVSMFVNKIRAEFKIIQLPEDSLFPKTRTSELHVEASSDKENTDNCMLDCRTSPNAIGSFKDF